MSDLSPSQLQTLLQQSAVPDYKMGGAGSAANPATSPLAAMYANDQTTPEWQAKYGPLSGDTDAQKTLIGAGRGIANVGRQVGNLVGLEPDQKLAEYAKLDAPLMATGAGRFGSMAGETAALAPLMMGGEGALGLTARGARFLANPVLRGVGEGVAQGGLMAGPNNRAAGAVIGGVTGGVLPSLGSGASRAVNGLSRTPEAQLLLNHGVSLTPGLMNPKGNANLIEQSVDRIPLVGPMIKSSRDNAEQDFGRAVIQQGAAPNAKITPSRNINEMFDQAATSWDPVYAQVHGHPIKPEIFNQGANVPLTKVFASASQVPGLRPAQQKSINDWLQARLHGLSIDPKTGAAMVEGYIGKDGLRSAIRQRTRDLSRSTDVDAPLMRDAYEKAENAVTQAIESQLPSDAAQTLRNADAGYSQLKVIEDAVAHAKDNLAGLTPSKLSQAISQTGSPGGYARGAGGPLRDLARAGTHVFETVMPPTGARTAGALAAAALGYASPHVALPIMGAAGGLGLLGAATSLGRRLAAGQTAGQRATQALLGSLSSRIPPALPPIAGVFARQAMNRGVPAYLAIPSLSGGASQGQP